MDLDELVYIDTQALWDEVYIQLKDVPRLAIDLEANSLFAYHEHTCLIQISSEDQDYILDPLAGFDFHELGSILENPKVEKVFHASEYDLILLNRDYGWSVINLFDTMWAARILGYTHMGLANFLTERFDFKPSKKYQKANWMQRPLPPEQIEYARADTHFLLELRDQLAAELELNGHMEEALETFSLESQVNVPEREFDPDKFWTVRGARKLKPQALAILRLLYIKRDELARERNWPVFKVISNSTMLQVASKMPRNRKELRSIQGISPRILDRFGAIFLDCVEEGREQKPPKPPKRGPRKAPEVVERFERLSQWRKEMAQERGVESDVIISRDAMWAIANENPSSIADFSAITSIGPHRIEKYGARILAEIQ